MLGFYCVGLMVYEFFLWLVYDFAKEHEYNKTAAAAEIMMIVVLWIAITMLYLVLRSLKGGI